MTKRILALGGLLTILGGATAYSVMAEAAPPAPMSPIIQRRGPERHPEMIRALTNLRQAKSNLEHAARDFGGHRAKALDLTNQAIREVELGIKYDRK